jgi:hypothetical protein
MVCPAFLTCDLASLTPAYALGASAREASSIGGKWSVLGRPPARFPRVFVCTIVTALDDQRDTEGVGRAGGSLGGRGHPSGTLDLLPLARVASTPEARDGI